MRIKKNTKTNRTSHGFIGCCVSCRLELKRLFEAKVAAIPRMMPRKPLENVTIRSSVVKWAKIKSFGHPVAFIKAMSLTLWDIITNAMKETITPPIMKVKIPVINTKPEKVTENPAVIFPSIIDEIPKPTLSAKRRMKSVDAIQSVSVVMIRVVWNFLRSKSFIAKEPSLIQVCQLAVF
jgi:hypothetical protein